MAFKENNLAEIKQRCQQVLQKSFSQHCFESKKNNNKTTGKEKADLALNYFLDTQNRLDVFIN